MTINESNVEVNIPKPFEKESSAGGNQVNPGPSGKEAFRSFMVFCALAGGLFGIMFGVTSIKSDYFLEFFEYNGLRYIALVLILAAVVLFGLTRVIENKDVTVLLSAIAGYLLGADNRRTRSRDDHHGGPTGVDAPVSPSCCPPPPSAPVPAPAG